MGIPAATVRCIRSGVDTAVYQPPPDRAHLSQALGVPPEALTIGMIAQFIPRKGHRTLVEAARAAQVARGVERVEATLPRVAELPLGGTAVGTGINTPPGFAADLDFCHLEHFEDDGNRPSHQQQAVERHDRSDQPPSPTGQWKARKIITIPAEPTDPADLPPKQPS